MCDCTGTCSGEVWSPCPGDCEGSCSGECSSCDTTCGFACEGGCHGDCEGCSGCGDCGGCDDGCNTTCKGQCTDSCNNGCKIGSMSKIYDKLSAGLELLIMKDDMSLIEDLIKNEYRRRAKFKDEPLDFTDISVGENVTPKLPDEFYQALEDILKKPNPEKEKQSNLTEHARMQNYIVILKALYNIVISQK